MEIKKFNQMFEKKGSKKTVNVIIITKNGIVQTPKVIEDDVTAQAEFDNIAEEYAGEDIDEINLHFDSQIDDLNKLIKHQGIEVSWFTDIEVNTYKN